jgi:hypothetical protein
MRFARNQRQQRCSGEESHLKSQFPIHSLNVRGAIMIRTHYFVNTKWGGTFPSFWLRALVSWKEQFIYKESLPPHDPLSPSRGEGEFLGLQVFTY